MKKLLLSTLILASGLMYAPLPGRPQPAAPAPAAINQPAQAAAPAVAAVQAATITSSYDQDIEAIVKEMKEAAQKGNVNPTASQEKALKSLNDKLEDFKKEYCPNTTGKHVFNNKITLDSALGTLDRFETVAKRIHTDLSANDSIFVAIYPKWYCDKAKEAYKTIKNIESIRNDISPSNYFVNKFKDGKKWIFASKRNFAFAVAATMGTSAITRCIFKEHNGWIKPVFNISKSLGSNILLPVFKYITWQ